jgi:hypothetical protein
MASDFTRTLAAFVIHVFAADRMVTIAVAVATEAATEAPEQEDDEDDDKYESNRHDLSPVTAPNQTFVASSHSDCEAPVRHFRMTH